ncbi:DNA cytosine methyltransferase [Nitrospirillum amazonense]|uniref:DNA cytosine methyltransferase n=1 Tax=Nitrospirillum amazonense TaxID=28077 RepID=UPI0024128F72|nr:DNA cytosine methyltransferase [Nitrospirillum amazonense]MDG3444606.1 DNA cytosine methyltransferase [Nitrospirillum amazonense]
METTACTSTLDQNAAAILRTVAEPGATVIRLGQTEQQPGSPERRRVVTFADQFCGAGGFTTGAMLAIEERGIVVGDAIAANHWPVAIATHTQNHPAIRHYCQDLATLRPLEAVPSGKLDLLIAAPSCIYHSRARGKKPTSDQQRIDPWYILPWLTDLDVTAVVVENVPEFIQYGPVDPKTGQPIPSKKGQYFLAWVNAICALGYTFEYRLFLFADYGDATTRLRFIGVFRKDGRSHSWPMPAYSRDGDAGLFPTKKWRAARDIIDWSRKGTCVFERPRPLASNTLRRIIVGVRRFFGTLAPIYLPALELELERSVAHEEKAGKKTKPVPIPRRDSQTTDECAALIELHGTGTAHSVGYPLPTIAAKGYHYGVVEAGAEALVLGQHGGAAVRPASAPLPTATTSGAIRVGSAVIVMQGKSWAIADTEPLPTTTGVAKWAVGEGFLCHVNHGGDDARVHALDAPLPAQPASRGIGKADGHILSYHHTVAHTATDQSPAGTLEPQALAQPFIIQTDQTGGGTSGRVRSADEPLGTTVTVRNAAMGSASIVRLDTDDPTLIALAQRRRLILVLDDETGTAHLAKISLPFRMLVNQELAAGASFPAGYQFAGTDKDITRQIGNAVPIEGAKAIIGALLDSMDLPYVDQVAA